MPYCVGKIRTRIEGLNYHLPHIAPNSLAIDPDALHIIDVINGCSGASRKTFGMNPVDHVFDLDFFSVWLGVLPVKTCPIHREQVYLVFNS